MAVEPGPNWGTGTSGSSNGGTPNNTQYDYRDDEVGEYPYEDYGITQDYTKEDMIATGDARRKAYFYATIGILVLLAVR